jgi:hypothetical protein
MPLLDAAFNKNYPALIQFSYPGKGNFPKKIDSFRNPFPRNWPVTNSKFIGNAAFDLIDLFERYHGFGFPL